MIDTSLITDPLKLQKVLWPHVYFYDKQVEIIKSIASGVKHTVVPAGKQLGKDFVGGFICLWYFLRHPEVRIITTSVKDAHIRVLWDEIHRYIMTSKFDLRSILEINQRSIFKKDKHGNRRPISYLVGQVSEKGEGMSGHHAANTLLVGDEASGIEDTVLDYALGWAKQTFIFGNPNPCDNFFRRFCDGGNQWLDEKKKDVQIVNVIQIRAQDSPNVALGLLQKDRGKRITRERLVPGVLTYDDYVERRKFWDPMQQCIGLDAEFYEGAEIKLFPPDVLDKCHDVKVKRAGRRARAMGIDAAEGGDSTVWTVVDEYGIIYQESIKTGDTSNIPGKTIAIGRKYNIDPGYWMFDRGGGGKQHADHLRSQGYNCRTVSFGEASTDPNEFKHHRTKKDRIETKELRTVYKNRRAEMYGILSEMCNQETNPKGFHIPRELVELRKQLAIMPKLWDREGRLYLPPKNANKPDSDEDTIVKRLGRSPDEADSTVCAVHAMVNKPAKGRAGLVR